MAKLDLTKFGIGSELVLVRQFEEDPAKSGDPARQPLLILISEIHTDTRVVKENSEIAIPLLQNLPEAVVVLEHFLSGQPVHKDSVPYTAASAFHRLVLAQVPQAKMIGGDHRQCLDKLMQLKDILCDRPHLALTDEAMARIQKEDRATVLADIERKKSEINERYLLESNRHECQWHRSRSFAESALASGARVMLINAGGHHTGHIWRNEGPEGTSLLSNRPDLSVVYIR